MRREFRFTLAIVSATALSAAAGVLLAQTPAQMEYERQQREYWRQQEQQRQEQQRQQQIMQENARRQQEESKRSNAGTGQSQSPGYLGGTAGNASPGRGGGQASADAWSAARAMWEKRPPLPPDRNPLLGGKWTRPASTRPNPSDPFAGLAALAKGGMCEVMFGGGEFEFRADKLVGMDQRTPEQELDKVEYRGDAKHVVVLPKATLKLIEFDFEGPDRISWTGQNCVLVRVSGVKTSAASVAPSSASGAPSSASGGPPTVASAAAPSATRPPANSGGVLALSVGGSSPSNLEGRKLWVLKEDPQVALIKGGITSTPYASVLQNWMRACYTRAPACEKGAGALRAYTVGIATTDAKGHAQTPPLPAGRYWVLSDAKIDNKRMMWMELVDVRGGDKSLTLDDRNALPVD